MMCVKHNARHSINFIYCYCCYYFYYHCCCCCCCCVPSVVSDSVVRLYHYYLLNHPWASLVAQMVKNLPAV